MPPTFHDRPPPEPSAPAGYAWLIDRYGLRVPLPPRLAGIATRHHPVATDDWLLLTPRHAPDENLGAHLTFALKWEGVDLSVLAALAHALPADDIAAIVRAAPAGQYTRRLWFLWEWLTRSTLDVPNSDAKRSIVPVLDPEHQVSLATGEVSARHRVRNTLPGTPDFCPLVRRTEPIVRAQGLALDARARQVIARTHPDVLARAAAFLQLSDSRASFAIEHERPSRDRAHRWAQAIARAGATSLSSETLTDLQRIVIGDDRFVPLGFRAEGGFVGAHDRITRDPLPEHISARADDLPSLVHGVVAYDARVREHGMDPVAAAAALSFGFVYIHPFVDGNGRLHRWLIHHTLAAMGYTPPAVVFPVSATMLREIGRYRLVLESYSRRLLPCIDWRPTATRNVEVLNATGDYYRYFDATAHAAFLYECVEQSVMQDLPAEVAYLEAYDRFTDMVQQIVDMPQNLTDLLHHFLRQNGGTLSQRARTTEFQRLTADEVARIEQLFAETTGTVERWNGGTVERWNGGTD
jgi:Fic/DOC family protein